MKINELKSLNLNPKTIDEIEVDISDVITSNEFNRKVSSSESSISYRERAIEKLVKLKKPFRSNFNIVYEIFKKFCFVKCPYCGDEMKCYTGSGNSDNHTLSYVCRKCNSNVCITVGSKGISISPPTDKD